MVKVEHCTCPVKHCFLKFKITDEFFVLLKSTGSLKSTKRAITKTHWLCGQVSGNILGFFLKTIIFFFMSKYFPSSKHCISLVLENYWLLQSSDSTFTAHPPCQWNIPLCLYFGSIRCLRISYQSNYLGGKRLSYACHCSIVNYSITFFFLRIRLKIVKKRLEPYLNFSIWKKRTVPLLRTVLRFIRTSTYLFKVIKY